MVMVLPVIEILLWVAGLAGLFIGFQEATKTVLEEIERSSPGDDTGSRSHRARLEKDVIIAELANPDTQETLAMTTSQAAETSAAVQTNYQEHYAAEMRKWVMLPKISSSELDQVEYETNILESSDEVSPDIVNLVEFRVALGSLELSPARLEEMRIAAEATTVAPTVPGAAIAPEAVTSSSLLAALSVLGVSFVSTLAASAGKMGHDDSTARANCGASTSTIMLNKLAEAATPLLMTLSMEKFGPTRNLLDDLMKGIWDSVLNDPNLRAPITPERAPEVSRVLFVKAMEAGMTAHFISVLAETVTPLKTLGMGYLAAFLGDMAGFAKIGGAMMGAVESQGLVKPFNYFINQRVRTMLPGSGDLLRLAGEYAITREQFNEGMAYQGYSDEWIDRLHELADRPFSPMLFRTIGEAGELSDELLDRELHNAGYNEKSIPALKTTLRRMATGELKVLFTGTAIKRYKEGLDTEQRLEENLTTLGVRPELLPRYVYAASLELDYDTWAVKQKALEEKPKELQPVMLATTIKRFKEGLDSDGKFEENLVFLGVKPELLPRYVYAAELEADYDEFIDYRAAVIDAVRKEAVQPFEMVDLLVERGMKRERAILLAQREIIRLRPKQA